jgi:LemA protein
MQLFLLPILGIVGVLILYVITTYNKFVTIKTQIDASIQEIGNQLKRQANLIPNLESSAKAYLKHEKSIYDALAKARSSIDRAVSGDEAAIEEVQNQISRVLPKLNVIVESNPQMQSADVVRDLMNELRDTADKLTYARRTLIDLAQDFNQMIVTFPSNLIGKLAGLKSQTGLMTPTSGAHLEVSSEETRDPKINL